jgi:hypothetical protein
MSAIVASLHRFNKAGALVCGRVGVCVEMAGRKCTAYDERDEMCVCNLRSSLHTCVVLCGMLCTALYGFMNVFCTAEAQQ